MNGRIPEIVTPLLAALCVGGAAFLYPPLALLALAALGARALMRAESVRIDVAGLAGPIVAALIVGAFVGLAGAIGAPPGTPGRVDPPHSC